MKELNIIGDIAGQYKTLVALLDKMPKTAKVFSVGDMIDRGPQSRQVLEFIMQNGSAVLGNHEHMMLDACSNEKFYKKNIWLYNKGRTTLQSFYPEANIYDDVVVKQLCKNINTDYKQIMEWMKKLPLFYKEKGLFISHAPRLAGTKLSDLKDLSYSYLDYSLIWNRTEPSRVKDKIQISGHNSHWGLKYFKDNKGTYAVSIDTSRERILTGLHWPSMEIFQQEYLD